MHLFSQQEGPLLRLMASQFLLCNLRRLESIAERLSSAAAETLRVHNMQRSSMPQLLLRRGQRNLQQLIGSPS